MGEFDIGRFLETGGKYAYEILSEEKKYKKKMDEIEAKIKGEREEEEKKRQTSRIEDGMDFLESMITSGKFNPETNRALYQAGLEMGLPLPMLPGMGMAPAPAEVPTAGTTMTGGMAGGLPPLRPEDVAGAGALFEAPPEEPEKYPQTRGEVREHEEFKAGLKPEPEPQLGKTPEERELDRAISLVNTLSRYDKIPESRKAEFEAARKIIHSRPEFAKRIAADVDSYYDEMIRKYKGNHGKAMKKVRKYMENLEIDVEIIRPYLKER